MTDLKDVKDRTPNQELIDVLEDVLECAKSGKFVSMAYSIVRDDNTTGSGWCCDRRRNDEGLLAAVTLLQADFTIQCLNRDRDTVFSSIMYDE